MKIVNVVCAPGRTGFYFDDQKAIKRGAKTDGFFYVGAPETLGFSAIRQAGESISLMLVLEDGTVAWGDCAAVQYSGAGGRDPLFLAEDFIPVIMRDIAPKLEGRVIDSFRDTMEEFEKMTDRDGNRLHTAIRYGLSQAILDCVSKTKNKLMCEVIAGEYGTTVSDEMIPIFSQTGDMRHDNADKMILKYVHVLPHALINNLEKLGSNGDTLVDYVSWLRSRVLQHKQDPTYEPVFHIDVYGMIGELFGYENVDVIADYLERLEEAARPFTLRIEGPIDAGSRAGQLEWLAKLTDRVNERGIKVELVADEWCNTVDDVRAFVDAGAGHMIQIKTPDLGSLHNTADAVLYCKEKGAGAYMGGTCNETNRSAEACVHVAMAMKPDQILAKPGMGVDEGVMIVYNEMQRILALRGAKR